MKLKNGKKTLYKKILNMKQKNTYVVFSNRKQ